MKKNVSLLLGAGVSIPAGLPSTGDITDRLLDGKDTFLNEYLRFDRELVLKYLELTYKKINVFYNKKSVNYEDIYYVTTQIKDFLMEYENPVVADFAKDIYEQLKKHYPILRNYKSDQDNNVSRKSKTNNDLVNNYIFDSERALSQVADMAANYINNLTANYLRRDNITIDHLSFIEEIISDNDLDVLNIFTLNHDLVLEKYFEDHSFPYYDGFVEKKNINFPGNIRVWQPEFINNNEKVRLLKLHGSIDWFRIEGNLGRNYQEHLFVQSDNISKLKEFNSISTPLILTGRFNKLMEYNRGVYVDLHYNFYRLLPKTDILLVSGYSFNDKGINSWLIDWMFSRKDHKIILIHPHPDKCINNARIGIKTNWEKWKMEDKIETIPIPIEEYSWLK